MQKVVSGVVSALEPRNNDWVAVHIQVPGKQYPVKLSTKRQELLQLAQSVIGQMVDALYNEELSDQINPHNNQPYTNRYLEQLAPAGTIPQPVVPAQQQPLPQASFQGQPQGFPQAQQQPQQFGNLQPYQQLPPQPTHVPPQGWQQAERDIARDTRAYVADDERENRIMRQAATKVAAVFLPMLHEDERNLGSLIRISEQLLKYYKEGVSWETYPPPLPPEPVAAGYDGDPGPEPGRPDDFPPGY